MTDLRLPRLLERNPVKLTISLSPELREALLDYAEAYGQAVPAAELIPAMLSAFIDVDRGLARRRRVGMS